MKSQFTSRLLAGLSAMALVTGLGMDADALTVRDDVGVDGSEELADNPIYDGVVQTFLVNKITGQILFNCSGSLINARTVVSAAHCFNDFPSSFYGLGDEPLTLIIGYGPDTFDSLLDGPIILGQGFELDARNGYTWANQVIIHPDADPGLGLPLDFPGADVALISLNDPLANLPTYSMLFSPIPVGTHVQMVAYGGDGIGSTGDSGNIDGKRQAGKNILGLVGSQNDFLRGAFLSPDAGVFPGPDGDQLLYYTDFDRPDRDTSECRREMLTVSPNDLICTPGPLSPTAEVDGIAETSVNDSIDWFPGDALPNEVGTVGGDSGSPLFADEIVDGELLITGVLSGGFTFTAPQPSGYGDISYYNPLFLFHQFISESNPYKYVGTVAGDGNWSDGDHWVQLLDPGYLVIDDAGNVVNGLPEGPEQGVTGTDPREGVVFDTDINDILPETGSEGTGDATTSQYGALRAVDFSADGQVTGIGATPELAGNKSSNGILAANLAGGGSTGASVAGTNAAANDAVSIAPVSLEANGALDASVETIDVEPELNTFLYGDIGTAGPWAGPGSTGAVPMNGINDGFFNYFDVTLGAAGTTTVDMDVVIDRLSISNSGATLDVAADQTFISLIDTQISSGTLDVSGIFASRDILNRGLVTGSETGLIVTDTLWNLGMIDAGTGLSVAGDVVFTSGGMLGYSGGTLNVDGNVSLDGAVAFSNIDFGQSGTLLTHTGERVGVFSAPGFNGVRQVGFDYQANQVDFEITAQAFTEFLSGTDLDINQQTMATLLDNLRAGSYSDLQGIYDQVDFLNGAALVNSLTGLTPIDGFQTPGLSTIASTGVSTHLASRFEAMRAGTANGTAFNARGSSLQLASLQSNELMGLIDQADAATDSGGGGDAIGDRGFGVFGEVSFSTGTQEAGIGGLESDIEGTTITIGADGEVSEGLRLGVFGSYSDGDSDFNSGLAANESDGFMVGAYGVRMFNQAQVSGYAGFGQRDFDTARVSSVGEALAGSTEADEIVAGLSISNRYVIDASTGFGFVPEARVDYQSFDISGYTETGGTSALVIDGRDYTSTQLKLGGDFHFYNTDDPAKATWRPIVGLRLVQDLDGDTDTVLAEFAATPGQQVTLSGADRDDSWFEPRAALTFGSPTGLSGSLFIEGAVDRDDLEYRTVGFNVKSRF